MTTADDDRDWSRRVFSRYNGKCAWPGCKCTFGIGGHHVIPRGLYALRLIVENGVLLCTKHHGIVEEAKGTKRYDIMIRMLIGSRRYEALRELEAEALLNLVLPENTESGEESSGVGF